MGRIVNETMTTVSSNPVSIKYAAYDSDDLVWRGNIFMLKLWDAEGQRYAMEAFTPSHGGLMSFRSSRVPLPDEMTRHEEFVLFHKLADEVRDQIKVLAAMEVL